MMGYGTHCRVLCGCALQVVALQNRSLAIGASPLTLHSNASSAQLLACAHALIQEASVGHSESSAPAINPFSLVTLPLSAHKNGAPSQSQIRSKGLLQLHQHHSSLVLDSAMLLRSPQNDGMIALAPVLAVKKQSERAQRASCFESQKPGSAHTLLLPCG